MKIRKNNNRKSTKGRNRQTVYNKPLKKLEGSYLTVKGKRLKSEGASEEELKKYTKNRYSITDAKPVKHIIHRIK